MLTVQQSVLLKRVTCQCTALHTHSSLLCCGTGSFDTAAALHRSCSESALGSNAMRHGDAAACVFHFTALTALCFVFPLRSGCLFQCDLGLLNVLDNHAVVVVASLNRVFGELRPLLCLGIFL